MSKENNIKVLPVIQTGSNCKVTAIAALDHYFGEKLNYSPIPLHKRFEGSALMSMREIAKRFGSQQGELLEIKSVTDILTYIGFEAETTQCDSLENFRKIIICNLAKQNPLISFFAVSQDRYLTGLPDSSTFDETNEHAALIVGFDENKDQVTIMHWGQYYTFPLYHLFESNQTLPTTRKQEVYLSIKSENLIRKYQILNDEKVKYPVKNDKLKVSIEPSLNSGFKNKLVQLTSTPDFKKIMVRRNALLADINLNYLLRRIAKMAPSNKTSTVVELATDYKQVIQAAIKSFLDKNDEKSLINSIDLANHKFFVEMFGKEMNNFFDINRKKSIMEILDKFKRDLILKVSTTATESKTPTSADLFMVENTVKTESKEYVEIFDENFLIETFEKNIVISARSLAEPKKSKFKSFDIDSITMDITNFGLRLNSKTNITITDISVEMIKNNKKLKSLLGRVQFKNIDKLCVQFDLNPEADNEMQALLKTIDENHIYINDQLKQIEEYYKKPSEFNDEKSDLGDSFKAQLTDILLKFRMTMISCAYSKTEIEFYLILLNIKLHRILPAAFQKNNQVCIPVQLNQNFMIGIFEGFKQALIEDEKYPLPNIKSSILDCLRINVNGHCKALSGYRSYRISLKKQKNPTISLEEIVKEVSNQELVVLQAMDDYRNSKPISVADHLAINSFILSVITAQDHSKNIMSGTIYATTMPHYLTLIDDEDRVMQLVKINSSQWAIPDFEGILKELLESKDTGEYIIYVNFSSHQTFFMLSRKNNNTELVFSDPNLSEYIFYDLKDEKCIEKIMKQLNDSHPEQKPSISPFYVTQLSPPNQKLDDQYGRTDMAWHAEQGNLELFKKTCDPALLSTIDSRGFTPLISAVREGHTEIVPLILQQQYTDKKSDVQKAINTAITEEKPEIINLFSPYFNDEIKKNALLTLMIAWQKICIRNVAVFDALLRNGVDVDGVYHPVSGKSWMSLFLDSWLFEKDCAIWNHILECKESSQIILHRSHDNSTILMDILNSHGLFSTKENILLSTLNYCKRQGILAKILPVKNEAGLTVFDLAAQKDSDLLKLLNKFKPVKYLDSFNFPFIKGPPPETHIEKFSL